jgi:hypothetical protein
LDLAEAGFAGVSPKRTGRPGYDANTWTVPLLASYLLTQGVVISARTLRRRIRAG